MHIVERIHRRIRWRPVLIFPRHSRLCWPSVDLHRWWRCVDAAWMPIVSVGYWSVFVRMCYHLMPRYSYRTDLIVVQSKCRTFSWYCRICCWNWQVVGIHCVALSRGDTMRLVWVLWWCLSSSLSSWLLLMPFLWLWLVQKFVSYQNHRFHHRSSTHTLASCQIAYRTAPRLALLIMMMPNSVYIECIGMIHQNGQCLRLAPEMTQKLCFSM